MTSPFHHNPETILIRSEDAQAYALAAQEARQCPVTDITARLDALARSDIEAARGLARRWLANNRTSNGAPPVRRNSQAEALFGSPVADGGVR